MNSLAVNPGSGPRHITFHPNGKYAYVMTELSSEVIVLTYNPAEGAFTEVQYISTIPAAFDENNQGSAIHISSDGGLYMQAIVVIIVSLFSVWIKTQVSLHLWNTHLQKEIGQETLY